MRSRALALALLALALAPSSASAAATTAPRGAIGAPAAPSLIALDRVTSARARAIARALPAVRALERTHPHAFTQVTSPVVGEWQVALYSHEREFVQVIVSALNGRVLGVYTGFKIAWTMARGYPGAFGRDVNALWVWLPLCALFLAPFLDWRRPLRMRNLDLLVLASLSASLAWFNHGDIHQSVPAAYPPLVYLLARAVWLARPSAPRPPPLRLNLPLPWLALGLVVLVAFRIGLNVANSNVIDVGYANVVGAQKVIDGARLYGSFPANIAHGDTYGPVSYEAYVPFVKLWGFSGRWDDLPAAHAAAVFFDLLCIALLFMLGWRIRGPGSGLVLAYAWAAFPFTALALESNSNDGLVAALVIATLLVASSPPARGALAALAGLAKLAPLALAPLLATYRLRRGGRRALLLFLLGFAAAAALALVPALEHDTLATIYDRTIRYQANRAAPFSIWGLYGGMKTWQHVAQALAVALALLLAAQRREHVVSLAAAAAAVLIALQLCATYWFYLYIPWFFAPAAVAFLGGATLETSRRRARRQLRAALWWDAVRGAWFLDRPKRILSGGGRRVAH